MPPPTGHNNDSQLGDLNEDQRGACTFELMRPSYESSATHFHYNTSTDFTAQLKTMPSEIESSEGVPQGVYASLSSQTTASSNKRLGDKLENSSELITVEKVHSIDTEYRSQETSDSDTSSSKDSPRAKRRRKGRKRSKESATRMGTAHPASGGGFPFSNISLMSGKKPGDSSLNVLSFLLLLALGSILLQPGPVPPTNPVIPSEPYSILDNLWLPSLPAPYKFGSDAIGQPFAVYTKSRSKPYNSDKDNRQKRARSHDSTVGVQKSAQYHQDLESKIQRLMNKHLERMTTIVNQREATENERQNSSKEMPIENGEREFFDPMIGHFRANPSTPFDSFFKSKLRWRGDAELAQYAWNQQPSQVNMLLTEQIPAAEGRRPPSPAALVALATSVGSAPATSPIGSSTSQQQTHQPVPATDPSLMDYEAIDIFWRQDLEQEKGVATIPAGANPEINYGNNPTGSFTAAEQFERDLQLLTEKSYLAPLNPEERQCYENLSKAHYTDFYRALGPPPVELGTKQQNGKTFDLARASSSGSGKLPGGLTEVSSYATPTSSRDAERRTSTTSNDGHQSDVSNTNSTLNETFGLDDKLFTGYDEETPEDFFRHLAKENLDDFAPFPAVANIERRGSDDLRDPLQLFTANVTMCVQHPALLNNVSLADAVPTQIPNDLFATNLTTGGTNTTMSEMFTVPQTSTAFENIDAANNMTLNSTDTWFQSNNTLNANELRNMSPEYPFMGSFNQTGFAPYLEDGSITTQFPENVTNSESTAPQNAPDEYGLSHSHYLDLSAYNETTTIIVDSDRRDGVSPSSGIGSMSSSSSSPRSTEEFSGSTVSSFSRFHSKLVPAKIEEDQYMTADGTMGHSEVSGGSAPRKRGRQSKDEQLVSENGLPATADQITSMTHQELQKLMRDPKLTATQKTLIKKIRRRGRNKVAARKCRERRLPLSGRNSVATAYDNDDYMYQLAINQISQNAMPSNVYTEDNEYDYARPSTSKDSMRVYYTPQSHGY